MVCCSNTVLDADERKFPRKFSRMFFCSFRDWSIDAKIPDQVAVAFHSAPREIFLSCHFRFNTHTLSFTAVRNSACTIFSLVHSLLTPTHQIHHQKVSERPDPNVIYSILLIFPPPATKDFKFMLSAILYFLIL